MIENENEKKEEEENDIIIDNPDLDDYSQDMMTSYSEFWILSIICWALFLFTGYFAVIQKIIIINHNYGASFIWSIINYESEYHKIYKSFFQMQMHNCIIILLFIITLIFATSQFIYFLIKSTYKKDNDIYDSMMGERAKYHFIPLLFGSCLFGIGIYFNANMYKIENFSKELLTFPNDINIYGVILSIFIITSLFYIYNKIEIKNETFLKSLIIKKGTFSCLIILSIYSLIINIYYCFLFFDNDVDFKNKYIGAIMITFIFFYVMQIIFGVIILILSIKFKDIVLSIMNIIIYIGITWQSLLLYGQSMFNNEKITIGYIILMIASLVLVFILIYKIKVGNQIN